MPAELSLYSLNFIDRVLIVRLVGLGDAGLYSLSVKFAQAVNVLVKGFQLAWPPLAYSIQDDDEARRAYAVIVTWFVSVTTFVVAGMWLLSRWIVRLLAAPRVLRLLQDDRPDLDRGDALRALSRPGDHPRPHRAAPSSTSRRPAPGTVVNIGLNLVAAALDGDRRRGHLAGRLLRRGAGADVRLHAAALQGPVRVGAAGAGGRPRGGAGRALARSSLPPPGVGGLAGRTVLWLAYPLLLWATGFLNEEEREAAGRVLSPATVRAALQQPARGAPRGAREREEPAGESGEGAPGRGPAPDPRGARGGAARRGRDPLAPAADLAARLARAAGAPRPSFSRLAL